MGQKMQNHGTGSSVGKQHNFLTPESIYFGDASAIGVLSGLQG